MAEPTDPPVNPTPWKQDFMTMFGYGKSAEAPQSEQRSSVFQRVWDMFQPQAPQKQKSPEPTQGTGDFENTFKRLIQQESRGRHRDASGKLTTSPVGALGVTQVMPKTGKDPGYGVQPLKDDSEGEYIRFGQDLLKAYTKELGGDMRKGLAAYNAGIGRVASIIKEHGSKWEQHLPAETKDYLKKVSTDAPSKYGSRVDGTPKGEGYFGALPMMDGSDDVATEISVGVNIDGKDIEIPLLTPNQSIKDIDAVLSGKRAPDEMVRKAAEHARQRIKQGKSPFAQKGEQKPLGSK